MTYGQKRGLNGKRGFRDSGGFVALPFAVLDSPNYQALSTNARSLLLEVARQYKSDNNGKLLLSRAYLAKRGWNSSDMISKGKKELLNGGFIYETVMGHRPNKASWYAVTWLSLDRHKGYDQGAAEGFKRGTYAETSSLQIKTLKPPYGASNENIVPLCGLSDKHVRPPHGPIQ